MWDVGLRAYLCVCVAILTIKVRYPFNRAQRDETLAPERVCGKIRWTHAHLFHLPSHPQRSNPPIMQDGAR